MKNSLVLLLSIIAISCSTQKVLQTDTQQDIDLSGRWNQTDAEIAANELFNNMVRASWLKDYQDKGNLKPKVEIREFDENFRKGGQELTQFFIQYAKASQLINYISKDGAKDGDFRVEGSIKAEEFSTENQKYINYIIRATLINGQDSALWEDNTTVKKYIKD